MLDTWERESVDDVLERIEHVSGDVLDQVRLAGQLTFSSDRLLPIDLAIGSHVLAADHSGRTPAQVRARAGDLIGNRSPGDAAY